MKTKLFLLAAISILLSACTVGRVTEAQTYASVYTRIPLAPNVVLTVETPVIAPPSPNHIWIDGYWSWDSRYRDYVWVQGYWALAPYVNAYWIPGYWEYNRSGYRWIDACWLPRDYHLSYGYYSGRYDYYGRPVYYQQPSRVSQYGYSYSYDHRPEYRGKGYSSSPSFNEAPKNERNRITPTTVRSSTAKTNQESIRIRTDGENQRRSESSTPVRSSSATDQGTTNSRSTTESSGSSSRSSSSSRNKSDSKAKSSDRNSNTNSRQSGTSRSSSRRK
jgi:hypothetical protein